MIVETSDLTRTVLAALQLRGVGPSAARGVIAKLAHGPAGKNLGDLELSRKFSPLDLEQAQDAAWRLIEKCASLSITVHSMLDPDYPRRLRDISDAPPVVYVKGSRGALNMLGCAVVGTREASEVGLKIAHKVSALCASRGISVISGLALGIDTAAHEGCLSKAGVTLAIMAHGLDTVAPTSNRKLAERIIDSGGALLSEHEPGVPPRPPEFVRRNRIQSGIALCSVIVESGEKGGAIHQARFTHAQGRPVLAVLPQIEQTGLANFRDAGGKLLVREFGALPMHGSEEILSTVQCLVEKERSTKASATRKASLL